MRSGHTAQNTTRSTSTSEEWTRVPSGCGFVYGSIREALPTQDHGGSGTERTTSDKAQVRQPAGQAASVMPHHCVATKAAHLLWFLPPTMTTEVADAVDQRVLLAFEKTNELSDEESALHDVQLSFSTTQGGMGLNKLAWLVDTAHVASQMQCASQMAETKEALENCLACRWPAQLRRICKRKCYWSWWELRRRHSKRCICGADGNCRRQQPNDSRTPRARGGDVRLMKDRNKQQSQVQRETKECEAKLSTTDSAYARASRVKLGNEADDIWRYLPSRHQ